MKMYLLLNGDFTARHVSFLDGNQKTTSPDVVFLKTQVTVKVVDFGCAGPLSSERGVEAPWRI